MRSEGYFIILTTGRNIDDCKYLLKHLKNKFNFEFDRIIPNLPTGKRVLINDFTTEYKAEVLNVKRNEGLMGVRNSSIFTK